jgi:hypothetical protein
MLGGVNWVWGGASGKGRKRQDARGDGTESENGGSTSFIGAVVAGVTVCVVEEERAEEGRDAEY